MSFMEGDHESKKDAILFGGAHLFLLGILRDSKGF